VDKITGFPYTDTDSSSGVFVISAEAILKAGTNLAKFLTASISKGVIRN